MPRIYTTLIFIFLTGVNFKPASAAMDTRERQELHTEIRHYLLENPEILIEMSNILQAKQEETKVQSNLAVIEENKDAFYNNPNSWEGGALDGDITIVEFVDYRCGYCRKAHKELETLIKTDGNIRFVVKDFPILGEQSILAAQFALAAKQLYGDSAYKAAHDALITMTENVDQEKLSRLAKKMRYNAQEIISTMQSESVGAIINENFKLAQMLDINGTPTFLIENEIIRGYAPLENMRQIVAKQRRKRDNQR